VASGHVDFLLQCHLGYQVAGASVSCLPAWVDTAVALGRRVYRGALAIEWVRLIGVCLSQDTGSQKQRADDREGFHIDGRVRRHTDTYDQWLSYGTCRSFIFGFRSMAWVCKRRIVLASKSTPRCSIAGWNIHGFGTACCMPPSYFVNNREVGNGSESSPRYHDARQVNK